MPTVIRYKEFRFFFFSKEGNEPLHIHVESNDNYAKFWLEPLSLSKSVGYSAKELNEIRKLVLRNMDILKEKWHEYFSR